MEQQCRKHHGSRPAARNPECKCGHQRTSRHRTVRGLGRDHTVGIPFTERFGLVGERFRRGPAHEVGHGRPCAGHRTDDEADPHRPEQRHRSTDDIFDAAEDVGVGGLYRVVLTDSGFVDQVKQLRDGEQADDDGDERHLVVEAEVAEVESTLAGRRVDGHRGDQQSDEAADQALADVVTDGNRDGCQPEYPEDEDLPVREEERDFANRLEHEEDNNRRHEPANHAREDRDPECFRGISLLGHRVGIQHGRCRAGCPGRVDQHRGDRPTVVCPDVDRRQRDKRDLRGHRQRKRQRDCDRVRPRKAGDRASQHTEGHTDRNEHEVFERQQHPQRLADKLDLKRYHCVTPLWVVVELPPAGLQCCRVDCRRSE